MWLFDRPIAHRGLHNEKDTENSMAAFQNAIDAGYNIETDVHILKSGEVVVFHDFTLKRVVGKNVKISELTLDDIKSDKYLLPNGEHIPLFSEFLELVEGKTGVLLELKLNGMNYDLEEAVLELIKGKESYIAVQAFNPFTIAWFAEHAPEFYRGVLSAGAIWCCDKLMYKRMQPNFVSYDIKGLTPNIIKYVRKRNGELLCWTLREPEMVNRAVELQINNIIFEKLDLDKLGFSMDKLRKPDFADTAEASPAEQPAAEPVAIAEPTAVESVEAPEVLPENTEETEN